MLTAWNGKFKCEQPISGAHKAPAAEGPKAPPSLFNNCSVFPSAPVSPAAPSQQLGGEGEDSVSLVWISKAVPLKSNLMSQFELGHSWMPTLLLLLQFPAVPQGGDGWGHEEQIWEIHGYINGQWWVSVLILDRWRGRLFTVLFKHSAGLCTGKGEVKTPTKWESWMKIANTTHKTTTWHKRMQVSPW